MSTALSGGAHFFVYALFLPIKNSINVPMKIPIPAPRAAPMFSFTVPTAIPIATLKIGPIEAKSQSFPVSLSLCFFEGTHLCAPGFGKTGFLSLSHTFGVTAPSSEFPSYFVLTFPS